ncbi:class I adenylate-forming enzyme family protein [Melghirimyces algeriensis]|nr:AMP-binding protein [Melghirimyces algeriensis]
MSVTIGLALKNQAMMNPDAEAVVTVQERYTFRELNERVNQIAHFLMERGIQKGDRVAILCLNDHPFVTIFMATVKIGAIAVPLNYRLQSAELEWIIGKCEPKMLFYDDKFSDKVKKLEDTCLQQIIQVSFQDELHPDYRLIMDTYTTEEPNVKVEPEDPYCLTYTSGTTGRPKGVISTHSNVFFSGMNTFVSSVHSDDRYLLAVPLFHISGVTCMSSSILMGFTLVLISHFHPSHIWDLAEKERVHQMGAVPAMLKLMLPALMESERQVETLREISIGGTAVEAELMKQYEALGYPVRVMYGATECTGTVTQRNPMGKTKYSTVGNALYAEFKVVDPDSGEELPTGKVGEVIIRGPQVFVGYWKNEEETHKVLKNGWYHTGDAGWVDEDGLLYVVDRYKDVIHLSGDKVYPAEVESVIQKMEGVWEVAVVGKKDPLWGETPCACVVAEDGVDLTEQEILRYTHSKLAKHKLFEVVLMDDLPKNSTGKVMKPQLVERLESGKENVTKG